VILDTGLGDSSVNFHPLQESIAELTRVCSFDRAGYGWSEPGPEPRTSQQIVDELATLLDTAGESGPYVLAGHSFGGLNMILFAAEHPDDVAGVVLIDSSHPEQTEALAEVPEILAVQDAEIAGLSDLAAAIEAGEVGPADVVANAPAALPDDLKQTWAELFAQPASLNTAVAEYAELATSMSQVADNGSLGDIPLVVLAQGQGLDAVLPAEALESLGLTPEVLERYDEIWRGLQEDHVTRSTDGTLVVAENSPHYIYFEEPEVVTTAIEDLVTAAQ
jgi:pimeloyl-ACP methyl ester carboxylesterase